MSKDDPDEVFFSYGYVEARSKVLCSSFKHPLRNIFQGTAFKKHAKMLIDEKQAQETSKLFFFLPSTTDRKEKINKHFGNVNLHPIDCLYEDFTKYSAKGFPFLPQDLESRATNEREIAREIVLNFMKHMTKMSYSN